VQVPHLAILQLTILKEINQKIQKLKEINKEFHAWAIYIPQVVYHKKTLRLHRKSSPICTPASNLSLNIKTRINQNRNKKVIVIAKEPSQAELFEW
jgi:hypothetical protein